MQDLIDQAESATADFLQVSTSERAALAVLTTAPGGANAKSSLSEYSRLEGFSSGPCRRVSCTGAVRVLVGAGAAVAVDVGTAIGVARPVQPCLP